MMKQIISIQSKKNLTGIKIRTNFNHVLEKKENKSKFFKN